MSDRTAPQHLEPAIDLVERSIRVRPSRAAVEVHRHLRLLIAQTESTGLIRPAHVREEGEASNGPRAAAAAPDYPSLVIGGGDGDLSAELAEDDRRFATTYPRAQIVRISPHPGPVGVRTFGVRDALPTADVVTLDEWIDSGISQLEFLEMRWTLAARRPTRFGIDLAAFPLTGSGDYSPLGLDVGQFWCAYRAWLRRLDVREVGIYGVDPGGDASQAAVKYAARLAHAFLRV